MNTALKLSIAALSATFAIVGVARAEEVRIDLSSKDAQTIHAEIVRAAHQVCRTIGADAIVLPSDDECLYPTIEKADAEARRVLACSHMQKAELAPALRGER